MTIVRVKGFQIFTDRHGRPRCYHRKTRQAVDMSKAPLGSAEFFAECARIAALSAAVAPKPGTLGKLIALYRAHADRVIGPSPDFPASWIVASCSVVQSGLPA